MAVDPFETATADIIGSMPGAAGTLTSAGGSHSVSVLIEHDIEMVDENGVIADRDTLATFLKSELPGTLKNGDVLKVGTTTYKVQNTVSDDGYAVQAVVR